MKLTWAWFGKISMILPAILIRSALLQVICGVMAVIMPGSTLGNGAILGAIAAADIGQTLADRTLFMGAPAAATTKHDAGEPHCLCHPQPILKISLGCSRLQCTSQP